MIEVEKWKALNRKSEGGKGGISKDMTNASHLVETGYTRDILAEKVGFKSGHEAERTINTVKKIDELKNKLKNVGIPTLAKNNKNSSNYFSKTY